MKGVITTYVEDEKPTINVKLTNDDKYVLVGDKYNPDTDESQARIDVGDNKATIYLTPRAIQVYQSVPECTEVYRLRSPH